MHQLIPEPLEYFFLLGIYLLILVVLFFERIPGLARSRAFWASGVVFAVSWTVLEIYGLRFGIWSYSEAKLCGLNVLTVPLEEYLAFFLIHLATCASWESFRSKR